MMDPLQRRTCASRVPALLTAKPLRLLLFPLARWQKQRRFL
jgi:hypothetical protein